MEVTEHVRVCARKHWGERRGCTNFCYRMYARESGHACPQAHTHTRVPKRTSLATKWRRMRCHPPPPPPRPPARPPPSPSPWRQRRRQTGDPLLGFAKRVRSCNKASMAGPMGAREATKVTGDSPGRRTVASIKISAGVFGEGGNGAMR